MISLFLLIMLIFLSIVMIWYSFHTINRIEWKVLLRCKFKKWITSLKKYVFLVGPQCLFLWNFIWYEKLLLWGTSCVNQCWALMFKLGACGLRHYLPWSRSSAVAYVFLKSSHIFRCLVVVLLPLTMAFLKLCHLTHVCLLFNNPSFF